MKEIILVCYLKIKFSSDKAIIETYKKLKIKKYKIHSFLDRGSDERQYNSPGIDLPITSIFRTNIENIENTTRH